MNRENVGVIDLYSDDTPIRIFYPAASNAGAPVNAFVISFQYFVEGYVRFLLFAGNAIPLKYRDNFVLNWVLNAISYVITWLPMFIFGHANLPFVAKGSPPLNGSSKFPVLFFSHGLTGSGEEHAILFSIFAQLGYVVCYCHHCDGSAAKARPKNKLNLYYQHIDFKNYDKNFRPNQIQHRESELFGMRQFVLNDPSFPSAIRSIIDDSKVYVGGFSYGAATAALSLVKRPKAYNAAILLDGWFHIDIGKGFDFPPTVHAPESMPILHSCPSLFIGSEHFAQISKLNDATKKLQTSTSQVHVIKGTRH